MRSRALIRGAAILALFSAAATARAQATGDKFADGLVPGDYARVAYGSFSPISPKGSIRDWNRGTGFTIGYENWDTGSGGVARLGFGLEGSYSFYPFNGDRFIVDFANSPIGKPISASASSASILQIGVTTRLRIPAPYIMPNLAVAFGFFNWRPSEIHYTTATASATAKQQNRSGGSITFSGGLDKHVIDRFAVFADASYTYAYTSFGGGLAGSGSSCIQTDCDLLKNTQLGVVRGGLRVRVGR